MSRSYSRPPLSAPPNPIGNGRSVFAHTASREVQIAFSSLVLGWQASWIDMRIASATVIWLIAAFFLSKTTSSSER